MDGDVEVVLESQTQGAGDGGSGKEQMQGGRELARAAASPASLPRPGLRGASQGPAQPPAPQAAAAHTRRVAFQSPMGTGDEAEEAAAGTPQVPPRGVDGDGSGTPYDSVLAMLRQGPLATNSPRSFPRPRSSSLLTAGAGRTPGPALAFGGSTSPSPLPPSGGPRAGAGFGGSRLGLHAAGGGSSTPSTGLRTAYTARSNSRFSRTPVHMQPLAAGRPAGSGGGGTSRFGLAAAAVAAAAGDEAAGAGSGPGTALLSPAPLAWTPMRSNLATGGRGGAPASGTKRKADSASPDAGGQPLAARVEGSSLCIRMPLAVLCCRWAAPWVGPPQPAPRTRLLAWVQMPGAATPAPSASWMRSAASGSGRSQSAAGLAPGATGEPGMQGARPSTPRRQACRASALRSSRSSSRRRRHGAGSAVAGSRRRSRRMAPARQPRQGCCLARRQPQRQQGERPQLTPPAAS